jgi:hypothetical protein
MMEERGLEAQAPSFARESTFLSISGIRCMLASTSGSTEVSLTSLNYRYWIKFFFTSGILTHFKVFA